jgi:hypothetical protein
MSGDCFAFWLNATKESMAKNQV